MFEAQEINAEHKDLIHDVAYNFHGDRMATCSSDQYVKVWDERDSKWTLTASWKAHSASVWKVNWAHPNYGQVLATCSFDRTAAVWEEVVGDSTGPGTRATKHWVRRANLVDSRTSVTDVKFGPKEQGLQLATCSEEGIIRIYEAPDVLNLSQWTLQHEIQCKLPLSCLDWNVSFNRDHLPLIAVGSDDINAGTGGKVFIYEYHDNSRKWVELETISSITEPVHDIAFSPNIGRTFHVLGVASRDVKILYLVPNLSKPSDDQNGQNDPTKLDIQTIAQFDDHNGIVWRVCWNIYGNLLASCGEDGYVRMFMMRGVNTWQASAILKGEGAHVPTAAEAARNTNFPQVQGMPVATIASQTARYFKLGAISQPSKDQWH